MGTNLHDTICTIIRCLCLCIRLKIWNMKTRLLQIIIQVTRHISTQSGAQGAAVYRQLQCSFMQPQTHLKDEKLEFRPIRCSRRCCVGSHSALYAVTNTWPSRWETRNTGQDFIYWKTPNFQSTRKIFTSYSRRRIIFHWRTTTASSRWCPIWGIGTRHECVIVAHASLRRRIVVLVPNGTATLLCAASKEKCKYY